jgi:hypothetical protein
MVAMETFWCQGSCYELNTYRRAFTTRPVNVWEGWKFPSVSQFYLWDKKQKKGKAILETGPGGQ